MSNWRCAVPVQMAAGKRVFVPGCGRGYDLVALLAAGAEEAVGLELAPTAVSQHYTLISNCMCLCLGWVPTGLGWDQAADATSLRLAGRVLSGWVLLDVAHLSGKGMTSRNLNTVCVCFGAASSTHEPAVST